MDQTMTKQTRSNKGLSDKNSWSNARHYQWLSPAKKERWGKEKERRVSCLAWISGAIICFTHHQTIIFLVISFGQALPHNQQAVFIALGVDMTHCTAHGNRASNNNSELSLTQKKRQCDMRWCFALYFNGSFSLLFLQTPEISEQSCPWTCVPCLLFTDPCHCF